MTHQDLPKPDAAEPDIASLSSQDEAANNLQPTNQDLSTIPESEPVLPPDGGLQAWTQVLMGHLVMITAGDISLHSASFSHTIPPI
jgi:hypothetical protein